MAESVTVGVRIRPLNPRELSSKNAGVAWRGDHDDNTVFRTNASGAAGPATSGAAHTFRFDSVFTAQTTNEAVYTDLASPVVDAALGGFNATMFAYGQTSSGKTHSMLGDDRDPGITPRAIRHVLTTASSSRTRDFLVRAVYVEIYNDRIRDLLNPGASDLMVREDAAGRTFVDACETVVHTFEDAMQVLEKGQNARHVGETKMNARSSRSHTVFTLLIESKPKAIPDDDDDVDDNTGSKKKVDEGGEQKSFRASSLNLVDLAGSERVKSTGATGKRQVEGAHINQSLLVLGTIINRLSAAGGSSAKVGHLPYRDSKLTRLLRPALGGNARTAILCAITPAAAHAEETLSTLKFAERAKKVTNHARRNEVVDYRAKYKQASTEVTVLRERLVTMELEMESLKAAAASAASATITILQPNSNNDENSVGSNFGSGEQPDHGGQADKENNNSTGPVTTGKTTSEINSNANDEDMNLNAPTAPGPVTPIGTSVVTSASSSPVSTPSVPVDIADETAVAAEGGAAPVLDAQGSAETSVSGQSSWTTSATATNTTSASLSTNSSLVTSSHEESSSALSSLPSSSSDVAPSPSVTGPISAMALRSPLSSPSASTAALLTRRNSASAAMFRGAAATTNVTNATTTTAAAPNNARARKLFSDTDAAVKREVELRAARDEARYLKALADETEAENDALKERLRCKAGEFSSLRTRAVELRSMAREARSHERALLRLVRTSFAQLEEARSQLDASRKKGSHVLLAEDKLTLLSQALARYARLGEEALKQDARAKHERAVVVRPKGTVAATAKNLQQNGGASGPAASATGGGGNPNVSIDNLTGHVHVGGRVQKAQDVDKAAALALRLGGIDEDLAAAFSIRPPPGGGGDAKKKGPEAGSAGGNGWGAKEDGRMVRGVGWAGRRRSSSASVHSSSASSYASGSTCVDGRGGRDVRRRRPRPLPEDMVADIDDGNDDDDDDGRSSSEASKDGRGRMGSRSTADWAEIDAEIDVHDDVHVDGVEAKAVGKGGPSDRADAKASGSRRQAVRRFYGYGQHGHGVYDVMVGGHKVDGKSSTGLAR